VQIRKNYFEAEVKAQGIAARNDSGDLEREGMKEPGEGYGRGERGESEKVKGEWEGEAQVRTQVGAYVD
jgi:hypothetical protein